MTFKLESLPYHIVCYTCREKWGDKNGNGVLFYTEFPDNARRVKKDHNKYNPHHNVVIEVINSNGL